MITVNTYSMKLSIAKGGAFFNRASASPADLQVMGGVPEGAYVFSGYCSTPALDDRFTRMGASTLENFASGLRAGAPLQDTHRAALPVGRSFYGEHDRSGTAGHFYIPTGIAVSGGSYATTDDYIAAIRSGLITDLSVKFSPLGFRLICDTCGKDMLRERDTHRLGSMVDGKIVTATILDAMLEEVSLVPSGATPGAVITHRSSNNMDWNQVVSMLFPSAEQPPEGDAILARIAGLLANEGAAAQLGLDSAETQRALDAANTKIAALEAQLAEGTARSADQSSLLEAGRVFRQKLISDGLAAGAKRLPDFQPDTWRSVLEAITKIETLQAVVSSLSDVPPVPVVGVQRPTPQPAGRGNTRTYKTG